MRIRLIAAALAALASVPLAWAADIDPDACFCLRHPSGQSQRGCRAEKFPGEFYPTAICRDPKTKKPAEPVYDPPNLDRGAGGQEGCEVCRAESSRDGGRPAKGTKTPKRLKSERG